MSAHEEHDVRYGTVGDEGLRQLTCWSCHKSGVSVLEASKTKASGRKFAREAAAFLANHPPMDDWASSEDGVGPIKSLKDLQSWIRA